MAPTKLPIGQFKSLSIEIPMILGLEDYHDIDYILSAVNLFVAKNDKIKAKEIGFAGFYVFVLYITKLDFDVAMKKLKNMMNDELKEIRLLEKAK